MNTGLKVRYQRIKRNLKPPYKKDSEKDSLWMHTTKQQKFLRELDPNRVLSKILWKSSSPSPTLPETFSSISYFLLKVTSFWNPIHTCFHCIYKCLYEEGKERILFGS